jgi:hypothetical protein
MANTIVNEITKWFDSLTATSAICDTLGLTFTKGTNLFQIAEPSSATQCLTVIPYPGSPPTPEGDRHESLVQLRLKIKSNEKGLKGMQDMINTLHKNGNVCASQPGYVFANQSTPIRLGAVEGGEFTIFISNYRIKHVKL